VQPPVAAALAALPCLTLPCPHPDGCCRPLAGPMGGCLAWSPSPALFVTTNRQTDTTVAFIYKMEHSSIVE